MIQAATRVFSNAAGSYSANVGIAIENGANVDEDQLQALQWYGVVPSCRASQTSAKTTEKKDPLYHPVTLWVVFRMP